MNSSRLSGYFYQKGLKSSSLVPIIDFAIKKPPLLKRGGSESEQELIT